MIFTIIIIAHFIADFVFQDAQWARDKSNSAVALTTHVCTYCLVWIIPAWYLLSYNWVWFILITFIAHWFTDFVTSKIVKNLFNTNKIGTSVPNLGAFTMIGLDQVLHYLQIYYTINFLTNETSI